MKPKLTLKVKETASTGQPETSSQPQVSNEKGAKPASVESVPVQKLKIVTKS
jgi:hypothetical protein